MPGTNDQHERRRHIMQRHALESIVVPERLIFTLLLFGALALLQGCAPVFSDFQSARLMKPGETEVTPAVTYVSKPQQTAGVQLAHGVFPRMEMRLRVTHVFMNGVVDQDADVDGGLLDGLDRFMDDVTQDFNVVSFGPKWSLIEDRLALHVPVDVYFSSTRGAGGVHAHPALLLSLPANERVVLNPSINAILPAGLVAVNLGAAVGDLDRWALRPEVGVLLNYGLVCVGVGVSFRIDLCAEHLDQKRPSPHRNQHSAASANMNHFRGGTA